MDFSSRWLADGHRLSTIRTTSEVVPSHLSILARFPASLFLHGKHGNWYATSHDGRDQRLRRRMTSARMDGADALLLKSSVPPTSPARYVAGGETCHAAPRAVSWGNVQ